MSIPAHYLIYGAIFLFAILLVEGLYYFVSSLRSDRSTVNRRMRMLSKDEDQGSVFLKLRRPDPESWKKFGILADPLSALNRLVIQTGLLFTTGRVLLFMVAGSLLIFFALLMGLFTQTSITLDGTLVLGLLATVAVLFVLVRQARRRLQARESTEPPDSRASTED